MCCALPGPAWFLHLNCVLNLQLRHSCTFAYSETGRGFSIFSKVYLAPPYHNNLSAPSFHEYALFWSTVYFKYLHKLAQA